MPEVIGAYCRRDLLDYSSITKMGCDMIVLGEIHIVNHHHQIFASQTTEKNVTYQEDPWQGSHHFLPYQVYSPIPIALTGILDIDDDNEPVPENIPTPPPPPPFPLYSLWFGVITGFAIGNSSRHTGKAGECGQHNKR